MFDDQDPFESDFSHDSPIGYIRPPRQPDDFPPDDDDEDDDAPNPWTCRQLLLIGLTVFVIVAMLITFYLPGILEAINPTNPPRPTPTLPGMSL